LLFSPRAQYHCNKLETKFVGAICGMGGKKRDDGRYVSVSDFTDLEVPFSQELGRTDVKIINEIRRLLNEAFCGNNDVFEWTSVPILKIQKKIEDYTMRFFNISDRKPISRDYKSKKKSGVKFMEWTELKASSCIQDPDRERPVLFRPHPIYRIKDATMYEMGNLYQSFIKHVTNNKDEVRKTICPLCCETFDHNMEAWNHIETPAHRLRSAKFKGEEIDGVV